MADALAEVLALAEKAATVEMRGRFARAAELRGRALAVALAAGAPIGGPESLIVALLRLHRASSLQAQARASGVPAEDAAALCVTAWALVCDATRTLRVRMAANTLLPGGLTATELQFWARLMSCNRFRWYLRVPLFLNTWPMWRKWGAWAATPPRSTPLTLPSRDSYRGSCRCRHWHQQKPPTPTIWF
jgi:hypothetical protein